jgi:hypothetical protein
MATELNLHNITKVSAESAGGEHAYWVDITFTDKHGREQEITLFCETMLLAGLIAKALNEAQIHHDQIVTSEAKAKAVRS